MLTPKDSISGGKEPQDSTKAPGGVSKVSLQNKNTLKNKKMSLIIFAIVAFIVAIMVFSGGKAKKANIKDSHLSKSGVDQTELEAVLNRLKKKESAFSDTGVQSEYHTNTQRVSKEYLARQNAPSEMYSAAPPAQAIKASTSVHQVTLSDHSAYAKFGNQQAVATSVSAKRLAHPRYSIASGEFIHAILETAIDSDLPGMIRAVTSQPVYAYLGEHPLIPAGSRLLGQYSSMTLQGINRVMVVWDRIILPNGITIEVNSPGVDSIGRAGQGANSVSTHFFARFGQAGLLSLIGAGVANTNVNGADQYNSAAQYRMSIAQSFQQSAGQALQNSAPLKPTLHVYQGSKINVFVAHDLSFYQVLKNKYV